MRATEFIPEKINPEVIEPGFEVTRRMKNGYIIRAKAKTAYDGIEVEVFDPEEDPELRWPIADVRFTVKQDRDTGELYMSSLSTGTKERYRRQGLASAMYNFARMLGNDLRASRIQTQQGQDFWNKGGAGAGRELELSDEPVFRSEPPPPPEPSPPPRPQGFWPRWKRLMFPDKEPVKS